MNIINTFLSCRTLLAVLPALSCAFYQPALAGTATLALEEAVALAIQTDPWLEGSQRTEAALLDESVAAASLPDPQLNLTAANVPTSFDFGQENMTQLAIGLSQQFPRGRSRALSRAQKEAQAAMEPMRRADRSAALRARVTRLYLETYLAQASRSLIEGDKALFEQLVEAAEAQYTSATGRARQQDLIRAQLELTRLDDRLTVLNLQQEMAQQRLTEFVPTAAQHSLEPRLPELMTESAARLVTGDSTPQALYQQLGRHPVVLTVDRRIDSVATGVDLAKQKYHPGFGVRAQYGYRAEDPAGHSRDDLLSVGLTFDMPLFRRDRQDREVSAALAREAAARTDRTLIVRELVSRLDTLRAELIRLNQRKGLYRNRLLPQMSEQAEASLAAYNNADGDFAEAVRARIAELDAKIDALAIDVARQQTLAAIDYLLTQTEPQYATGSL